MTKFVYLLSIVCLGSWMACSPARNFHNMRYFADSVSEAAKLLQPAPQAILQPGDRIYIVVSSLTPEAAAPFNLNSSSNSVSSTLAASTQGYLIGADGTIPFPQLGRIAVAGKTTKGVADTLETALLQFLKEPVVKVDLVNFKVHVLGEVNHPGTLVVPDGKMTVLEAISQSGDLTLNGLRENVLVVRERNGQREFGRLNLASNEVFSSPYYYLQQGDVVYVDMNKNKLISADATEQRNFRVVSIVFATISTLALLYNLFK